MNPINPNKPQHKRKYDRLDVSVKGALTIKKIQGQAVSNKSTIPIMVENVSTGGIFFTSNAQLPVSPLVLYEVVFVLDERRIAFMGTVQRKTTERMGVFGYGFAFEHDSYQDFSLFYSFMQKKLIHKKK